MNGLLANDAVPVGMWYVFTDSGVRLFEQRYDEFRNIHGIYDTEIDAGVPLPREIVDYIFSNFKTHYDEY